LILCSNDLVGGIFIAGPHGLHYSNVQELTSWRRGTESVASSVVSASKMLDSADESRTTPPLPDPALFQHLC
jgi:hypothetical protein